MKDSYYTPTSLARKLLTYVRLDYVDSVADFCIGGGELLRAAERRWPKATLAGTDISEKAIARMKRSHKTWKLGVCDFIDDRSRCRCKILRNRREYDLVLLNPPFSCLGSLRLGVTLDGIRYQVSTAMAFVVEALKYLKENGQMYAILPNSVAYSEKDRAIWEKLKKDYRLKIIEENDKLHFAKCSARVIIVSLGCPLYTSIVADQRQQFDPKKIRGVFRGKTSVHLKKYDRKSGVYYVHTTNMIANKITQLKRRVNNKLSEISGPAVLIPRVGLPKDSKICLVKANQRYSLSDCVIAIKTRSNESAKELQTYLISNAEELNETYKGTAARYTTVRRVKEFLSMSQVVEFDLDVETIPASIVA